ncbi:ribonuclease J [bacterium]|nr:ribonuclease J [bacterium]
MKIKTKKNFSLSITPLGGVREIGKNCFVIECDDEMILVDAGIIFPAEDDYGVDVIIPNFEYLLERADKLKGIIITHGHEDHIGALTYLFRDISSKIYTTNLTAGLIENKFIDSENKRKLSFEIIEPGDEFTIGGNFHISTALINHSIPAGIGLRIQTPAGTIVHSGDFKLDQTPINDERTDLRKFGAWGESGVDILMIDVTNVSTRGFTPSERRIGLTFERIFERASSRIFIAMFSSHFHRIQQAVDVAERFERKVVILGRSMILNVQTARELGYLKIPDRMIVEPENMDAFRDEELMILATGSQGEPMSVLSRMASGEHQVSIRDGDRVIISANPIPGNEAAIGRIINRLFDLGAKVITSDSEEVHVSGHASREEIKILYNTVSPRYVMPFHGESRNFMEFRDLMLKMGRQYSDVLLTRPGDRIRLYADDVSIQSGVTSGEQLVRGDVVEDEWVHLANERSKMASAGVIIAAIFYNKSKREVVRIELNSRGFVNRQKWEYVFERAETSLLDSLNTIRAHDLKSFSVIRERSEQKLSRLFFRHTGLRPLIIVKIIEVK